MEVRFVALSLSIAIVLGCGESRGDDDGGLDGAIRDAGRDAEARPEWPGTLPPTSEMGERRGRALARVTVHLHSPLSHDACDGRGWADGELNAPQCLENLRAALCALRLDAAMLTDHGVHLNEVTLERALWFAEGDEPIQNAEGAIVANHMRCPDGHRVLLTVGSENALMPIGLERHPGDTTDPDALRMLYRADGPESAATLRETGALIWQAHTEGRSLETLRALGLDGLEIYNLHANVDPRIREEHLGLEPFGYAEDLTAFTNRRFDLPPDLAVLAFLSENENALVKWDTLLAEGARIAGTGGCDAHENALPMILGDGERADSYRRMMLWVQNHLLVDERSPEGVREALARGRLYVVFEVLGTPIGFDFVAESEDGVAEMGDDAPLGATLSVTRPALPEGFPAEPAPVLSMRILRAEAGGAVEVASGDAEHLEYVATEAGAYRAEVRMRPEHARGLLGDRADRLIRELVWVYSNPIFVGD